MGIIFLGLAFKTKKMMDIITFNQRSSVASRVMIWRSAQKMLENDWAMGIGPSNFQEKYLDNQKYFSPYLEWAVPHPHSIYLAFWLSAGLLGFLTFLLMLFSWFRDFFGNKKRETALGFVSLGIILYFFLHGLADTTYFKNDLAVVFWLAFLALL